MKALAEGEVQAEIRCFAATPLVVSFSGSTTRMKMESDAGTVIREAAPKEGSATARKRKSVRVRRIMQAKQSEKAR